MQVFILSPASCSGQRAALLFNERAQFFLARQLRASGAALGEVFSFLSGLYFRGKLTYARAFSGGLKCGGGVWTITAVPGGGGPGMIVSVDDFCALVGGASCVQGAGYCGALGWEAGGLAGRLPGARGGAR